MQKLPLLCLAVCFICLLTGFGAGDRQAGPALPSKAAADTSRVVAPGAQLQLLSSQFSFTEGPAADKKGNVYFTDQPNDRIWKYGTNGRLTLFLEKTGRANGLYVDRSGALIACADEKNELWRIRQNKKVDLLVSGYNGRQLNGPNDVWVHPGGGLYFTDPLYRRPYWTGQPSRVAGEHLYYLPAGSREPQPVDTALKKPNGIIGSPDGRWLYVADLGDNKTYRYAIQPDGRLADRQLFAPQGSDGMTIDNKGNIYLTGNGITVYDAAGTKIEHIPVPRPWTANVCFAGRKGDHLFITAGTSVYLLRMQVKGAR